MARKKRKLYDPDEPFVQSQYFLDLQEKEKFRKRKSKKWLQLLSVFLICVISLGAVAYYLWKRENSTKELVHATTLQVSGLEVPEGHPPLARNENVSGRDFIFLKGEALFGFTGGANVRVVAPAKFSITSPGGMFLKKGTAILEIEDLEQAWACETPHGVIESKQSEAVIYLPEDGSAGEVFGGRGSLRFQQADGYQRSVRAGQLLAFKKPSYISVRPPATSKSPAVKKMLLTTGQSELATKIVDEIKVGVRSPQADAVEYLEKGNVVSGEGDLVLSGEKASLVGLCFSKVGLPQGAKIMSAHLQLTSGDLGHGQSKIEIRSHRSPNGREVRTHVKGDISRRPLSKASVMWNVGDWSSSGMRGQGQRSPNIRTLIQELVNLDGWHEGCNVFLILGDTVAFSSKEGQRRAGKSARSFERGKQQATTLVVKYVIE